MPKMKFWKSGRPWPTKALPKLFYSGGGTVRSDRPQLMACKDSEYQFWKYSTFDLTPKMVGDDHRKPVASVLRIAHALPATAV